MGAPREVVSQIQAFLLAGPREDESRWALFEQRRRGIPLHTEALQCMSREESSSKLICEITGPDLT